MNQELNTKARDILSKNIYITLSTINEDGTPWTTPLFFAYSESYDFYFVSPSESVHGKNLTDNKNVSAVVFDSHAPKWQGSAVYLTGECVELKEVSEVKKALKYVFGRLKEKVPYEGSYMGENYYKAYKLTPSNIWVTNDKKSSEGKSVDARAEVNL